jgi:hypothetical protein
MTHSLDEIENAPATGGDQFRNADHEGDLIVLTVTGTGRETFDNGESEFIVADITVVEPDPANKESSAGDTFDEAWVFGRVIFGQLKRKVGRTFVGRIAKGQAQKGRSAPWQLDPASPDEVARVREFMRSRLTPPPAPAASADGGPPPTELGGDDAPPWARR